MAEPIEHSLAFELDELSTASFIFKPPLSRQSFGVVFRTLFKQAPTAEDYRESIGLDPGSTIIEMPGIAEQKLGTYVLHVAEALQHEGATVTIIEPEEDEEL